jgi:hypothetical protein
VLVIKDGPLAGQRIPVEAELVIGRHDADITIQDEEVSRRHAVIRPVGRGLEIEDVGSLNGTWINGTRIQGRRELAPADVIRIGSTSIELEFEPAARDLTVARPQAPRQDQTRIAPRTQPTTERERPAQPAAPAERPSPEERAPAARAPEARPQPPEVRPTPVEATSPAPPLAAIGAAPPPSFGFAAAGVQPSRRRSVATRRLMPTILSFAAIVATAAALIVYFAVR